MQLKFPVSREKQGNRHGNSGAETGSTIGPRFAVSWGQNGRLNDGFSRVGAGNAGEFRGRLRVERNAIDCVAAREGLEPPTFALGKRCSILLSYRATRRRS